MPSLINLELQNLTVYSLENLPNLRRLHVKDCNLSKLDNRGFQTMPSLEVFELFGSNLTNLCLKDLCNLRKFRIDEQENIDFLQTLPKSLYILTLRCQTTEGLQFSLSNLQVLNLSFNKHVDFDAGILSGLPSLRHLEIDFNKDLGKFNLSYEFLTSLERLTLRLYPLELIDFSYLVNLRRLKITGSRLNNNKTPFDTHSFDRLKSLEEIYLNGLNLTNSNLKGIFRNLKSLRVLDLYDNKINDIDEETFGGLENVRSVNLDKNDLNDIKPDLIQKVFPKLEKLIYWNKKNSRICSSSIAYLKSIYSVNS